VDVGLDIEGAAGRFPVGREDAGLDDSLEFLRVWGGVLVEKLFVDLDERIFDALEFWNLG